jgi:hypothetical protein
LDANAEFVDFSTPTKLSASYSQYKDPQCGFPGNPWGYGRHHIYPRSLLAQFIGSLSNFPELYTGSGKDFCAWVESEIMREDLPLLYRFTTYLQKCLPHNEQIEQHYMPWLESTASSIKGKVFNDRSIMSKHTFEKYNNEMRVYIMRATVGMFFYMNEEKTKREFSANSACVEGAWHLWYSL